MRFVAGRIVASGVVAALALLSRTAAAETEELGVAGSGLSDGNPAITTRADVSVAIESEPGTPGARLKAIGDAVQTKLADIRTCYSQVAELRPIKEGAIRARISLEKGVKGPRIEVREDGVEDAELSKCVLKAIQGAPLSKVDRPASGVVLLEFANTAARGARMVAAEKGMAIAVTRDAEGRAQASGGTATKEVEFTITALGTTATGVLTALHQGMSSNTGKLLDCRRRAGRRSSPAGEVVLAVKVAKNGARTATKRSSTVAFANAPQCLVTALRGASMDGLTGPGQFEVSVRFNDSR